MNIFFEPTKKLGENDSLHRLLKYIGALVDILTNEGLSQVTHLYGFPENYLLNSTYPKYFHTE